MAKDEEANEEHNEQSSEYIKKNLFYAVIIVMVIILIIALALSIFSLFNSGSQGVQGPPGPQGMPGLPGREGSPCKCVCTLPTTGTTIVDNFINGANGGNAFAPNRNFGNGNFGNGNVANPNRVGMNNGMVNNGMVNNGMANTSNGSQCSRLKNFIAGLSQDDINLVLNSTSNNAIVNNFKTAIISYQNTGNVTGCGNLNITQLQNWLVENNVQTDFYQSVFDDISNLSDIDLSAIDLSDKNMNYFVSVLNKSSSYSNLPKNRFVNLTDQEMVDFLISLLKMYGINNTKLTKIILKEIERIALRNDVDLTEISDIGLLLPMLPPKLKNKISQNMGDDNLNEDLNVQGAGNNGLLDNGQIYVSNLENFNIESNKNHIFTGRSRKSRIIDVIVNAKRNYNFDLENRGDKITLRLIFRNANKLETENGSESDLLIKPRESRRVMADVGNVRVEN